LAITKNDKQVVSKPPRTWLRRAENDPAFVNFW